MAAAIRALSALLALSSLLAPVAASTAYTRCPNRLGPCATCPTTANLPSLPGPQGSYPGSFLAHASLTDSGAQATLINPDTASTALVPIDECCGACRASSRCAYWHWFQATGTTLGRCGLFDDSQCSTAPALASLGKFRTGYTSVTMYAFKKCAAGGTPSTVIVPSGGGGGGDSAPVTPYNTTCPTFACTGSCPADDSALATFPGATAGRLFETYSPATGPTLVLDQGEQSVADCCTAAMDGWRDDVRYFSWERTTPGLGRCRLLASQACNYQTADGNTPGPVFGPTVNGYTFSVNC